MDYQKLKAERHRANLDLIATLSAIIESMQGEQRFVQILRNYGFVSQQSNSEFHISWHDEFNLEPIQLLDRVRKESSKVF